GEIRVVHPVVADHAGALLAGDEVVVRRDVLVPPPEALGERRTVVRTAAGTGQVEPRRVDGDRFREGHLDRGVARGVDAVRARVNAQQEWTELDDGRRPAGQ